VEQIYYNVGKDRHSYNYNVFSCQDSAGCSDGCVIVDPNTKKLLVAAHPVTKQHPLHHAVMVAIDLVAKQQGAGSYTYRGW